MVRRGAGEGHLCACATSALSSTLGTMRVKNPGHAGARETACLPLPETLTLS